LYVKDFPPYMMETDLHTLFSDYGEIEQVKLFAAKQQDRSPYALICFKLPSGATDAKQAL
jgi:RNA recognition motif-containing protein